VDQIRDLLIAEVSQMGIRGSDQGPPRSRGELEGGSVDQIRDLLIAEVSKRGDPWIRTGTTS
jgi:hypothetical protein